MNHQRTIIILHKSKMLENSVLVITSSYLSKSSKVVPMPSMALLANQIFHILYQHLGQFHVYHQREHRQLYNWFSQIAILWISLWLFLSTTKECSPSLFQLSSEGLLNCYHPWSSSNLRNVIPWWLYTKPKCSIREDLSLLQVIWQKP